MHKWLGPAAQRLPAGATAPRPGARTALHVTKRMEELQEAGMSADADARLAHQQFGNYTAQMERTDMDIAEGMDAMFSRGM